MGYFALACAVAAAVAVAWPGGMYLAMGLALFAGGAGLLGYRRRSAPARARLAGAGAMALGTVALSLATLRYGLALAALRRLEHLLG
jgi:hypothetical protein